MNGPLGLAVTVLLLAANAFFVAAEFALVSARRAAVEPLADRGSRRARTTLFAMERVSVMLAGAQLGITLASVALGAVSEPVIARLLEHPLHGVGVPHDAVHPIAFVIALLLVTLLHVVLGEMVPKNVALAEPERAAVVLAPMLAAAVRVARPVIALLNGMANGCLRLAGVRVRDEVASAFTREQVAEMIEQSHRDGLLAPVERDLLGGALAFDSATVADVALPLSRAHTLPPAPTAAQVEALAARTGVTRFPVRDRDGYAGYVHLKDTLAIPGERAGEPLPAQVVRTLPEVSARSSLAAAVEVMRAGHAHVALVRDEDTVVGLLTLDDVLLSLLPHS